jgi:hypothetical protein
MWLRKQRLDERSCHFSKISCSRLILDCGPKRIRSLQFYCHPNSKTGSKNGSVEGGFQGPGIIAGELIAKQRKFI